MKKYMPSIRGRIVNQVRFQRNWMILVLCEAKGVKLFGDLPIFVARDSVDVWATSVVSS